uniref:Cytochrome c-553 n=1 Tax=Pleonosporium borreri TaxID=2575635 RepID=A0A4D6WWH0_9FLOR|nr:cytochrome c553 [Pleonosporium borreri]
MKSLYKYLIILFVIFGLSYNTFAAEADIDAGALIFSANCAACHANGKNSVMPDKTLAKEVLIRNDMYSIDAITTQVTNGKNAMIAFGDRLSEDEIFNVANYVLSQAEGNKW